MPCFLSFFVLPATSLRTSCNLSDKTKEHKQGETTGRVKTWVNNPAVRDTLPAKKRLTTNEFPGSSSAWEETHAW